VLAFGPVCHLRSRRTEVEARLERRARALPGVRSRLKIDTLVLVTAISSSGQMVVDEGRSFWSRADWTRRQTTTAARAAQGLVVRRQPETMVSDLLSAKACSSERLLLDELTHRVNNELAAAIAVASVEIARTSSEELKVSLGRVRRSLDGFARVHRALRAPDLRTRVDACAYLRALCGAISVARLEPLAIELRFVEAPLRLDSEHCWKLGIIVCELVTNASRHAFTKRAGRITVEAHCTAEAVCCSVSDDGEGAQPSAHGLGLRIIDALLRDLDGTLERRTSAAGSTFTVSFPKAGA
jgi:two-component sensor histidine kinase